MELQQLLFLVIIGIISGTFGAIVGASLLVLFPTLIFYGIAPHVALGTATLACCARGITAVRNYSKAGLVDTRRALSVLPSYLVGTVAGSLIILTVPESSVKGIVAVFMVLMGIYLLINPKFLSTEHEDRSGQPGMRLLAAVLFFLLGLYNGIYGGGVTVFIIFMMLYLFPFDLIRATATTAFFNLLGDLCCAGVFALRGKIDIYIAIPLMLGMLVGGHIGSSLAILKGNRLIRWMLIGVVFILAAKMSADLIG